MLSPLSVSAVNSASRPRTAKTANTECDRAEKKAPKPAATRLPEEKWSACKWLDNIRGSDEKGITGLLAKQLIGASTEPDGELKALQELASSDDVAAEMRIRLKSALENIVEVLEPAIRRLLVGELGVTPEEMQDKFLQDGAGILSFGGLDTFFGGLERKIGAPDPKVGKAMKMEHTDCDDSEAEYTTPNFVVTTTSSKEYLFVTKPTQAPSGGWPVEAKPVLAIAPAAAVRVDCAQQLEPWRVRARGRWRRLQIGTSERQKRRRRVMPLEELQAAVDQMNTRLSQQGEPSLILEEAIAGRLYTGPMFVKYNAVLRGLDSPVLFLREEMLRLCASAADADAHAEASRDAKVEHMVRFPSFDERRPSAKDEVALRDMTREAYDKAARRANKYTTTLHAINSLTIKVGKLSVATKVYRGVNGRVLPEQFWCMAGERTQYRYNRCNPPFSC